MTGLDYVAKRVAFAIVTIFAAVTLNFILFRAIPGDAVQALRCQHCTVQFKNALREELGLDKSRWEQYKLYLADLAHGDLGSSVRSQQPVWDELWPSIKNTLPMITLGYLFAIILGTVVGVVAAWRRGTAVDKGGLWTGLGFYSMPPQWLGMMIVLFVAGAVGLPTSGIKDPTLGILEDATTLEIVVDRLRHMILPALTIGLVLYGEYALIVRSAMLETLGEDYVLTARAKGFKPRTVLRKHALRNAMLPITTLVALSLGYIVAGAILVETVFSWPGIGRAVYDAVLQRDYPMLQGAFLVLTVSVVFFNLVADLLYFKLDPRITE